MNKAQSFVIEILRKRNITPKVIITHQFAFTLDFSEVTDNPIFSEIKSDENFLLWRTETKCFVRKFSKSELETPWQNDVDFICFMLSDDCKIPNNVSIVVNFSQEKLEVLFDLTKITSQNLKEYYQTVLASGKQFCKELTDQVTTLFGIIPEETEDTISLTFLNK